MTGAEELIAQARSGDRRALGELVNLHAPDLHRLLTGRIDRKWQSVLAVEDVMQVTFMEIFLRFETFTPDGPGSFGRWAARVALNNLRDATRDLGAAKRHGPPAQLASPASDDSYVALVELVGCTTTTPSREAGRREIAAAVDAALHKLPPDYERVVRLYDLEGRPIDDVAAAMTRSAPAVHMLRARAHDRLRELLGSGSQFFSAP